MNWKQLHELLLSKLLLASNVRDIMNYIFYSQNKYCLQVNNLNKRDSLYNMIYF